MGNIIIKLLNEDLICSVFCIFSNSLCIIGVVFKRIIYVNIYWYMVLINKF